VSHTYYLNSLIETKKGDLTGSSDSINRAIDSYRNSIMKQNSSTYATILKYSPIHYSYLIQKLKIRIKISPTISDLKQISNLKRLYKEKYQIVCKNT